MPHLGHRRHRPCRLLFRVLGGDLYQAMGPGSKVSGETYVYGLPPGRYQYGVDSAWCPFSASEPISWVIEIERL